MADSGGNDTRPSVWPYEGGRQDEPGARSGGDRVVPRDRMLETKRLYPVIPAERVVVFTG